MIYMIILNNKQLSIYNKYINIYRFNNYNYIIIFIFMIYIL